MKRSHWRQEDKGGLFDTHTHTARAFCSRLLLCILRDFLVLFLDLDCFSVCCTAARRLWSSPMMKQSGKHTRRFQYREWD